MTTLSNLEVGDKLFYRNGTGNDVLVFVRDWADEQMSGLTPSKAQ